MIKFQPTEAAKLAAFLLRIARPRTADEASRRDTSPSVSSRNAATIVTCLRDGICLPDSQRLRVVWWTPRRSAAAA